MCVKQTRSARRLDNNAESMNHVLKMAIDWKPQSIPGLVDSLRDVIKGHYIDAERAFIGRENYRLSSKLSKFQTSPAVWANKSEQQRELWWGRFMKAALPVTDTPSTSADGGLTVLTAPGGKMPCQTKRKRNANTRIVSGKRPCTRETDSD